MKTVGDLYDKLKAIEAAEDEVRKAGIAIGHGGNEATMRAKHEHLNDAHYRLSLLRDEPLYEADRFVAEFFWTPADRF